MSHMIDDNRFVLIEKYKQKLIEGTNISDRPEEMAVIDSILFRLWQMGWLDKLEQSEPHWIPVTERLPEDNVYVLLTIRRMDDSYNHVQFISTGYISWNHQYWWCAHDGNCKDANVEVLAWMPLPEPYKPTVPPECEGDCGWCKPSVIEKCKGVTK